MTSRVDINRVLMQMREMRTQIQPQQGHDLMASQVGSIDSLNGAARSDLVNASSAGERSSFSDLLKQAVDSVNETQVRSSEMQTAYEMGDGSVDITQVMIQMQKASVSFEAMTQVRNRLVSAYQDIMNMPL
ncbi:MAG: flagellar hook-basal body complex protein FliE [Gammaproteobacteria bacterium]|nr:flagellar hook-basal body complex protein FliE [Gammaproteobacteria bacterium]MDP2140838.1 flagellar hook-basal body complex protein FliE [Gammaproteobacteria bacterium]MDP2349419.1 flagellar hook-basal body complex protein FliE [Gammaproteobacteria bacterium]